MMRLWLIFFSVGIALLAGGAGIVPLTGSNVSGRVEISPLPDMSPRHEHASSDIVVWLKAIHPAAAQVAVPEHAQLLQKDKMFHPHTLAITVGSVVDFPNADPIFHNAFSNFDGELFDVGLYPPGTTRSVHFKRPGIVRVFCNIHPAMSAVIVVVDTPYVATASRDGRYNIPNVAAGTYEVHVFDERATAGPKSQTVLTVDGTEQQVTAPSIHLLEAKYLNVTHKNKYGLDYPPSSENPDNTYTGLPR